MGRKFRKWIAVFALVVLVCVLSACQSKEQIQQAAYEEGYNAGYQAGFDECDADRYDDGYYAGITTGYAEGKAEGYDDGVNDAFSEMIDYCWSYSEDSFMDYANAVRGYIDGEYYYEYTKEDMLYDVDMMIYMYLKFHDELQDLCSNSQ